LLSFQVVNSKELLVLFVSLQGVETLAHYSPINPTEYTVSGYGLFNRIFESTGNSIETEGLGIGHGIGRVFKKGI
jgi:hypothetical protein